MGHANRPRRNDALGLDAQSWCIRFPFARHRPYSDSDANDNAYTYSDTYTYTYTYSYSYA